MPKTTQKKIDDYKPVPVNHISQTSKMPCKSWSLEAGKTCKGSINSDGSVAPACLGCYAKGGTYVFANVRHVRQDNYLAWQLDNWEDLMVEELEEVRLFRWFDSGDIDNLLLLVKIFNIMKRTPHVKHWLPTRMYKFPEFKTILDEMKKLNNVCVRYSSDSILGQYIDGLHGSTIVPDESYVPDGGFLCKSYENNGECGKCRACWNKNIPVIFYKAHGQKIKRVYKRL